MSLPYKLSLSFSVFEQLKFLKSGFAKNVSWTFIGGTGFTICQWGVFSILAKMTNPSELGSFALALAILSPTFLFWDMQLANVIMTDKDDTFSLVDVSLFRLCTISAAILSSMVFCQFMYIGRAWGFGFVLLAKITESLIKISYAFSQKANNFEFVGRSQLIRGAIAIALCSVFIFIYRLIPM